MAWSLNHTLPCNAPRETGRGHLPGAHRLAVAPTPRRNMRDAVRLQELEDACGVHLVFVENQFGPGAAGALSFNVMAAVAQYYSDNLRTEVLKGMDEKVRQGWPTGGAPFGYMNVDDRNEPVQPHPEKGPAVARIWPTRSTRPPTVRSRRSSRARRSRRRRRSRSSTTCKPWTRTWV